MNWQEALNQFSDYVFTVEKRLDDLHTIDWSFVDNLPTFVKALTKLRIYFFTGTDKFVIAGVFKDKILIGINSSEKLEFLQNLLESEIWSGYVYWLFAWTCSTMNHNERIELDFMRILHVIIAGFRTKEFLHSALEIFKLSVPYMVLRDENLFWTKLFLDEGNQEDIIYSYNIVTYVLPTIKQLFDTFDLKNIYLLLQNNGFKKLDWALHILKLSMKELPDLLQKLRKHYKTGVTTYDKIIFEILCKIKSKYQEEEVVFLSSYIRRADYKDLTYLAEMMTTYITYNNTDLVLLHFQKVANVLVSSKMVSDVEKGAAIYIKLVEVSRNECLLSKNGISPMNFENDVLDCVSRLDYDSMEYLFEILGEFKESKGLIDKDSIFKCFVNICKECESGHLDEKIVAFLKFMQKHFLRTCSERVPFVIKLWTDMISLIDTDSSIIKYKNKLYTLIKIFTITIKEYKVKFKSDERTTDVMLILHTVYATYFSNEDIHEYNTLKYAEKIVTAAAELLVLITKDRELTQLQVVEIFMNLEVAMNCNMRFSATAVASFYKQFVAAQFTAHKEYFLGYISLKLKYVCDQLLSDSTLRRSGEYRMLIHGFCTAVPGTHKKLFVEEVMKNIVSDLKMELNPAVKAVRFHCITALIQDRQLKSYTERFLAPLIYYSLLYIDESYKLNAAATLLLEACIKRILPNDDNEKNMCVEDLFYLYPKLMILWDIIDTDNEPFTSNTFSKALFLSIFQRTNTSNSCLRATDYNTIVKQCLNLINAHKYNAAFALDTLIALLPFDKITVIFNYFFAQLPLKSLNDCLFYWWLFNLLCTKYMEYNREPDPSLELLELYNFLTYSERLIFLEQINIFGCSKEAICNFRKSLVCMEAFASDLRIVHLLELQMKGVVQKDDFEEFTTKYFIPALLYKIKNKVVANFLIGGLIMAMYNKHLHYKIEADSLTTDYDEMYRDCSNSPKYSALIALILADNPRLIQQLPSKLKRLIMKQMTSPDDATITIAYIKYGTLMCEKDNFILNSLYLIITSKHIDSNMLYVICDTFKLAGRTFQNLIDGIIDLDYLLQYFDDCKVKLIEFIRKFKKLLTRLNKLNYLNVYYAERAFLKAVERLISENALEV